MESRPLRSAYSCRSEPRTRPDRRQRCSRPVTICQEAEMSRFNLHRGPAHGAQNQPPVPSKVLPPAQAATTLPARCHTSPITGRVYAIRLEPRNSTATPKRPRKSLARRLWRKPPPRPLPKAEATKKSATGKAASSPADISDSEFYRGTDRKAAKLSIADGAAQGFHDVRDLIAALPSKTAMVNHTPRITTEANSGRSRRGESQCESPLLARRGQP